MAFVPRGEIMEKVKKEAIEPKDEVISEKEKNEVEKKVEKVASGDKKKGSVKISKIEKKKKIKKQSTHSKKYIEIVGNHDLNKKYPLEEAVALVKQLSYSKFDGTISLAVKLEKSKKSDDAVRGTVKLPHGSGKTMKVEIATDEIIEKIKKGWTDFDVLVASPSMMPKLAQVAKVLGPKGKMPNPKDGTVVDDPKSAIEDLGGKVIKYRADIGKNIHMPVGKISWEDEKLLENINIALKAVMHLKKQSVTLSPSMGPGVRVDIR